MSLSPPRFAAVAAVALLAVPVLLPLLSAAAAWTAPTGEVWQHPTSGRCYPAAARLIFDRPKPVACLTRCLELASEQYREILEGISSQCGTLHRAMLLWHDNLLVQHPVTQDSPGFAT